MALPGASAVRRIVTELHNDILWQIAHVLCCVVSELQHLFQTLSFSKVQTTCMHRDNSLSFVCCLSFMLRGMTLKLIFLRVLMGTEIRISKRPVVFSGIPRLIANRFIAV